MATKNRGQRRDRSAAAGGPHDQKYATSLELSIDSYQFPTPRTCNSDSAGTWSPGAIDSTEFWDLRFANRAASTRDGDDANRVNLAHRVAAQPPAIAAADSATPSAHRGPDSPDDDRSAVEHAKRATETAQRSKVRITRPQVPAGNKETPLVTGVAVSGAQDYEHHADRAQRDSRGTTTPIQHVLAPRPAAGRHPSWHQPPTKCATDPRSWYQ
jgi:hypothetical protein